MQPVAAIGADAVGRAGRAPHAVVGVAGGDVDPVAARPGDHDRGALEVDQPVVAATAVEPIAAGAAEDMVVAGTAGEPLTAAVAVDQVVAAPAPDLRAGPAGAELVVPRAAHDRLAFAQPDDEVHPSRHAREQRLLARSRPACYRRAARRGRAATAAPRACHRRDPPLPAPPARRRLQTARSPPPGPRPAPVTSARTEPRACRLLRSDRTTPITCRTHQGRGPTLPVNPCRIGVNPGAGALRPLLW